MLVLLAGTGIAGALVMRARTAAEDRREAAARAFASAWERRDADRMWSLLSARSRADADLPTFRERLARADEAATADRFRASRPRRLVDGVARVRVRVQTRDFGTLRGVFSVRTRDEDGRGRVDWTPAFRLPGLRGDEDVRRRRGAAPPRGEVLAADGSRLGDDPIGAGIAGVPRDGREPPTGLERIHERRLVGRPASTLLFGRRVIRKVAQRRGRSVHTTIRLGLTRAAQNALGDRVGGVAVIRPRDGAVLALAGLAVSAPQPPGSTFKIITLAAALQNGVTSPGASFPVRTAATLSGVRLENAGGEPCGGSLATSFAKSCNSVFAPLGAELGARRLLAASERFGFNEVPRVPAAKESVVPRDLEDAIAVGSAAIGQERLVATPLQMASVAATIANRGVRVRPRVVREDPIVRRRVVGGKVARTVRDMMVGVVRGGTGRAAALPGVTVAGKTGTAELSATGGRQDPSNTTAWFVAFAPAQQPRVAVAVMLSRAGHGGETAAPVARRVLRSAL